jgi:hypothetical protein
LFSSLSIWAGPPERSNLISTASLIEELALLRLVGTRLNLKPSIGGCTSPDTARDLLIAAWLKVRSKTRGLVPLILNRAQREYSERCGKRNIVLKARQLGVTTYVAARFFIQTVMQPGTLSVQVAHDQESAEEIFKIVHRFWENLPETLRHGVFLTSRANIRQLAFLHLDSEYRVATAADAEAGRGLTIHNLHCSEVARWPGDIAETMASLRAAVPKDGEIVLESTPNGAGGAFYEEWQHAMKPDTYATFFPGGTTRITSLNRMGRFSP